MSRLEFGYCKPCENEVAVVDGECAVCGQPVENLSTLDKAETKKEEPKWDTNRK